jgi:hypothetical protein
MIRIDVDVIKIGIGEGRWVMEGSIKKLGLAACLLIASIRAAVDDLTGGAGTCLEASCTIIGRPNGVTSTYASADGSIAGNPSHNPFIQQNADFPLGVIGISGDPTLTQITNFQWSFGTTAGDVASTFPITSPVPLPPAALLFGTALAGLGILGRRRRSNAQA